MSRNPTSSLDILTPCERDARIAAEFASALQYAPCDMRLVVHHVGTVRARYSVERLTPSGDITRDGVPVPDTFLPPVPFREAYRWIQGFRKAVYLTMVQAPCCIIGEVHADTHGARS